MRHWNRRLRRAAGSGRLARYGWLCRQHAERLMCCEVKTPGGRTVRVLR